MQTMYHLLAEYHHVAMEMCFVYDQTDVHFDSSISMVLAHFSTVLH